MKLLRNWGVGLLGFALAACGSQVGVAQESPDEMEPLAGEIHFEGDQVVFDVENTGRHSLVTVNFGDSEDYKLIIDTGSGSSLIDTELAEALGFEVVDQREVLSGGVDPIMLDVVRVPFIQVGEMEVRDAEILTAPLSRMTGGSALGVLGMNLFSDHLIAFNQQENQVIVSTGTLYPDVPGTYAMVSEGQFVDITIDVAGTPVNMHIDTGAPGGFTFPLALADELPLMSDLREGEAARMVGGSRNTWLAQLDGTITLAGRAFENPPISFLDPAPSSGNLGNQVSGQFLMTVDQANRLVRFEPLEARAITQHREEASRRRVGIQFGGIAARDLDTIGGVVPGSLAEQAGLQAADRIVSLNDRAMSEYDMSELGELLGGHDPLRFEIDRNGILHSIVIE